MFQMLRARAVKSVRAVVPSQLYWREIRPPQRGLPRLGLRELWAYRDLPLILALREQLTCRQTLLGVAWVVLQPLVAMLIFTLVFGRLAKLPSDLFRLRPAQEDWARWRYPYSPSRPRTSVIKLRITSDVLVG